MWDVKWELGRALIKFNMAMLTDETVRLYVRWIICIDKIILEYKYLIDLI